MWKLLRNRRGMTLAELLIASGLISVIAAAGAAVAGMLYRANNDIQRDFLPMTQANLTIEAIYQRVLRAPPIEVGGVNHPFLIENGGTRLIYQSITGPTTDVVEQVGDLIVLRPSGAGQETLMHGVRSIHFRPLSGGTRLGIDLVLAEDRGAVGSSVFPRNSRMPRQIIN